MTDALGNGAPTDAVIDPPPGRFGSGAWLLLVADGKMDKESRFLDVKTWATILEGEATKLPVELALAGPVDARSTRAASLAMDGPPATASHSNTACFVKRDGGGDATGDACMVTGASGMQCRPANVARGLPEGDGLGLAQICGGLTGVPGVLPPPTLTLRVPPLLGVLLPHMK